MLSRPRSTWKDRLTRHDSHINRLLERETCRRSIRQGFRHSCRDGAKRLAIFRLRENQAPAFG